MRKGSKGDVYRVLHSRLPLCLLCRRQTRRDWSSCARLTHRLAVCATAAAGSTADKSLAAKPLYRAQGTAERAAREASSGALHTVTDWSINQRNSLFAAAFCTPVSPDALEAEIRSSPGNYMFVRVPGQSHSLGRNEMLRGSQTARRSHISASPAPSLTLELATCV